MTHTIITASILTLLVAAGAYLTKAVYVTLTGGSMRRIMASYAMAALSILAATYSVDDEACGRSTRALGGADRVCISTTAGKPA